MTSGICQNLEFSFVSNGHQNKKPIGVASNFIVSANLTALWQSSSIVDEFYVEILHQFKIYTLIRTSFRKTTYISIASRKCGATI